MAGLGKALRAMGKTGVLGKTPHETDPTSHVTVRGVFQEGLPYKGYYNETSRYYFPTHSRERPVTGVSAGHGNESAILKMVARHPSDPFGLRNLGIDNLMWEPDWDDIHDMAYVQWVGDRSVYSEIERVGGLLDQLGLRDGASGGGQGDELARLREELKKEKGERERIAAVLNRQTSEILAALAKVKITDAGGKPMGVLREIRGIVA